jgi:hypothetical protein
MLAIKSLWLIGQISYRSMRLVWRAAHQLGLVLWREA